MSDTRAAVREAARVSAPTIATAVAASVAATLVLVLSPVPMVRGFGVLLAVGIAIAFACALTAGSAALVVGARRGSAAASLPDGPSGASGRGGDVSPEAHMAGVRRLARGLTELAGRGARERLVPAWRGARERLVPAWRGARERLVPAWRGRASGWCRPGGGRASGWCRPGGGRASGWCRPGGGRASC